MCLLNGVHITLNTFYRQTRMPEAIQNNSLPLEHETMIVQLLGEAEDLIELVAKHFPNKESHYLLQSLFLVLRQMGYYFTEDSSPLLTYESELTSSEKATIKAIVNIRHAVGHRESKRNFLSRHIKLVGGYNFQDGDVVVQYGKLKLRLVSDILQVHERMRTILAEVPELDFLKRGPLWNLETNHLEKMKVELSEKLQNPEALLNRCKNNISLTM